MRWLRIHHVAFRTRDLARLVQFYRDFLKLRVIRQAEGRVWLEAGSAIVMLETAETGEPEIPANCKEFLAFEIGANELQTWRNALSQACLPFEESPFTLYFRDPDGRRIGLSCFRLHHESPGRPELGGVD